jgi:hypothetical protein
MTYGSSLRRGLCLACVPPIMLSPSNNIITNRQQSSSLSPRFQPFITSMATPAFGFSAGDFIAGIKLVKDLIDSLDEAVGAGPAFRRLAAELRSLERALTEVKNLRVHQSQAVQKVALEQAASQCKECIDTFLWENTKFSNTLGALATKSKWRTNLRKFQWAVCKPDVVSKFRAEIAGHVLTVNTLMATMQL